MALSHQMSRRSDTRSAQVAASNPGRSGVSLGWVLVFFAALQLGSFVKTLPLIGEETPRAGAGSTIQAQHDPAPLPRRAAIADEAGGGRGHRGLR